MVNILMVTEMMRIKRRPNKSEVKEDEKEEEGK